MKQIIWIILIVIFLILGFIIGIKIQSNNNQNSRYELIQENNRLLSQRNDIVECFSAEISSIEMCLLNCHDLSCYQKCKISNNDVLDKCYRNEE